MNRRVRPIFDRRHEAPPFIREVGCHTPQPWAKLKSALTLKSSLLGKRRLVAALFGREGECRPYLELDSSSWELGEVVGTATLEQSGDESPHSKEAPCWWGSQTKKRPRTFEAAFNSSS